MMKRIFLSLGMMVFLFLSKVNSAMALYVDPYAGCANGKEINTALGCIPIDPQKFVGWLLPILFGITGGIAFLLMVYGFIMVATSSGDEKKVQGAKETITSAVIGLIVSVFALFLLRLIAVDVLKIPGIN